MKSLVTKITEYKFILPSFCLYFIIHLVNLTSIPIFNDESIYLDWGWSSMHIPSLLFISLSDAKQPLMIWLFGIAENIIQDPLLAGRLVSVAIGSLTLIGIYFLAKQLFNTSTAIFGSLTYMITPLFVFYNRQALFESAVACTGIWLSYIMIKIVERPKLISGVIAGIILGIGFFIKSSFLIFLISFSFVTLYILFKKKQFGILKPYIISLAVMGIIDYVLLANPLFWKTFSSNSRYILSPSELITFPIFTWTQNIWGFIAIGFIFVTPLIFISSIIGSILVFRKKNINNIVFLLFFLLTLLLEIILTRNQSQRYVVPFLPFLVILSSVILNKLWHEKVLQKIIVIISLSIPFILTVILILNPPAYILGLSTIAPYSETGYLEGQTSGYGISQTMEYIKSHSSQDSPSLVLFGVNTGNPENAIDLYSQETSNLYPLHIEGSYFQGLNTYTCMTSDFPMFLITRDDQLLGMDRFFTKLTSFASPYNSMYSIGIYTLKNCKGKPNQSTPSLSKTYYPVLRIEQQYKLGHQ